MHRMPQFHAARPFVAAIALLALAISGCGGDPAPAKPGAAGGSDAFVAPDVGAPSPAPVKENIGAAGGAVQHSSGGKLKVAAGALPADVELSIEAASPPASVAAVGTPVGPALILGPEGQTFLVPVQIGVPIDPAMIKGLDPAELQLVLAPSGGGEFVGLETVYDAVGKQLLAETSHFSIVVPVKRKGPALKLTLPSPLPTAKVGAAYGPVTLQAAGGKPPFSWSLAGGNLAPGLALAPDGKLAGTPEQAGKFAASVRVKDAAGQVLEKALALEVDGPPNAKPTLDKLDPASAPAGSGDTAITATGKDFAIGALLTVGGKGVPTVRVSATELKAKLTAAQLASAGVLDIAAVNPPPGGGAGSSVAFAVTGVDADAVSDSDGPDVSDGAGSGDSADGSDTTDDAGVDGSADASPVCVPAPELCDGKDNDCNGQTDDNPCCTLAAGAACDDGSVCTTGEKCTDGLCLGGDVTVCVDDNLCTDNTCDPKLGCNFPANAAPCNDDKACTQGDTCQGKACAPGKSPLCDDGNACTLDQCSETAGCSHLPLDGGCDDGNGCTVGEVCKDGACGGAEPKSCDDSNPCSLDQCDKATGKCSAQAVPGCGDPCQLGSDCKDDGNPCTLAECVTGACAVVAKAGSCDDGDACTSGDACQGGLCTGAAAACNDGNVCTNDVCGKDGKCSYTPGTGGCEDGNACTVLEACKAGVCVPGAAANCEDANACTDDSCDPKVGCLHPDSATPCTDDNPCSIGDACKGGKCTASGPKDCDDGDACTADSCDSKDGLCASKPIAGCGDFCNVASDCLDDKNPCTEWECAVGKCAVLYPTVGCDDSSACTVEDTCAKGSCAGSTKVCDDANVCSDDSCDKATGCVFLPNAASCTDGQVCTVGDGCKDKACIPGKAADCDDFNECTFDTCDAKQGCTYTAEGLSCSDDDPCTLGDACVGSSCVGGKPKACDDSNACTLDICDPNTGKCGFTGLAGCGAPCATTGDCPAGPGPCLALTCAQGVCAASETTATCDDGSVCTAKDSCVKGQCAGSSADCDDGNGCTADTCNPKTGCAHQAMTGPCEDGDLCTVQDACIEGPSCKAGLAQQCADGNPCTVDACDPKVGCQFAAIQAACSDGDPCTTGDACAKGECLPGDPSPCDDGSSCTTDSCDSKGAKCVHASIKGCGDACQGDGDCLDDGNPCTAQVCSEGKCGVQPQAGACDDGNPCTSQDACAKSACGGSPAVCSDGNPCTTDACDPKTGCTYSANTAPCALGNACQAKDQCKDKVCTAGPAISCDDGNSCTLDTCDPDSGCQNTATSAPCDDGSPCTAQDECTEGVCIGGVEVPCNDGSACTADTCDNASGKCVFAALKGCGEVCAATKDCPDDSNPCTESVCVASACVIVYAAVACDDGDPCSAADSCNDGKCQGSEDACDDGNACTADSCDAQKGCSSAAKSGPCDDGSACTSGDACDKGACKGSKLLNCDDGNPCTTDACDPGLGCASVPNKAACSDGNLCTIGDQCAKGLCEPGDVKACDDGKPCTLDVCDQASGKCKSAAVIGCGGNCAVATDCEADSNPCTDAVCTEGICALALNATACDDGNACTGGDACDKGLCIGGPKKCEDDNSCTLDSCDAKSGCVVTPIGGACDDGNACTSGEACSEGKCAGGKAVSCVDANICTDDSCEPTQGCVLLPNKVTCDDDNQCTSVDKCLQTYCIGAAEKDCDDKNPCTQDSCSTVKGCVYSNNSAVCEDGNACTEGDSCDKATGCKSTANSATNCTDGNACTKDDACAQGKCAGTPVTCNDNVACTVDSCAPATGCKYAPNNNLCNDFESCTTESCDAVAGCKKSTASDTSGCTTSDPCVTTPVCLSGTCSQKPHVSVKNMPYHPVAVMAQGGGYSVFTTKDPQNYFHVLSLDADFNANYDVKYAGGGKHADGNVVASSDPNGTPRLRRLNMGDGGEMWSKVMPMEIDRVRLTQSGEVATLLTWNGANSNSMLSWFHLGGGNVMEQVTLPGHVQDVRWTGDSGHVIVCGWKLTAGSDFQWKPWVARVQETNYVNIAWEQILTSSPGGGLGFYACSEDGSGGVYAYSNEGSWPDVGVLRKINGNGNIEWIRTKFAADAGHATGAFELATALGGVVVVGSQDENYGMASLWSSSGNFKWTKVVPSYDVGMRFTAAAKGTDLVLGGWYNNVGKGKPAYGALIKLNSDGTVGAPTCTATNLCTGKTCNDNVACTIDSCDPKTGCVYTPDASQCDDGNICTANSCDAVKGCTYAASTAGCDDKNPCTTDTCDPIKGCTNTANTAPCDDANACTVGDTCGGKACIGGGAKSCEDGLACTAHSCDKATGCKQTANNAKCDDGKQCTADTCDVAKGCTYAPDTKLCDDANVCTEDSCDNGKGCTNLAIAAVCNDGNACTLADACAGGICKGGKALVCDDLNECTSDSCNPSSGCATAGKPDGTPCTPSTTCSATAQCGGGTTCYDGPSKYYKLYLDNTGGGSWAQATLSPVYDDGAGFMYLTHDGTGNGRGLLHRRTDFANGGWDQDIYERSFGAVKCTPWATSYCFVAGRNTMNNNAVAERRNAATGNLEASWSVNLGGNYAMLTDVGFINGETTTPFFTGWRNTGGANFDAYVVNWGGGPMWKYEGPGDEQATSMLVDTKNGHIVVGFTNSKGGGGYDGFWDNPGNGTFGGATYGGPGDEYFYNVLGIAGEKWAVGTGSDTPGGGRYVLLVRISNSLVVKKINTLTSGFSSGAVTDGSKIFVASGSSIVSLDSGANILWQTSYNPISPLNFNLMAIAMHKTGLIAAGTGYNGQTGKTGIAVVRSDIDGVINCTDKNPCASLQPGACDDKVSCTFDSCDSKAGCKHQPDSALCDDGNPCTVNNCDELKGCLYPQNNNVPCNDNNPCTLDTCDLGAAKCVFTVDAQKACEDNNACTNESCTKAGGCVHAGQSCDDGNPCTNDSAECDPAKGCTHALVAKPCDDSNPCTIYEACDVSVYNPGKCMPFADICAQAVAPVLHTHIGVSTSIQQTGGKIDAWTDVQKPSGFWSPYISKPVIAKGAVFGRDGIDMGSSGMRYGWNNNGSWTAAFVFRSGPGTGPGTLFTIGAWKGLQYQGKLMLNTKGSLDVASVPVDPNKSYIVIARMGLGEGKLLAFSGGSPKVSAGVVPSQPAGNFEMSLNRPTSQADDANPVFGEVLLYDKALSDSEVTVLATQLQKQWGLTGCQAHSDCDDANGCTQDFCEQFPDKPKECTHGALTLAYAGACKDSNPCTIEEQCDKGQCVGSKPFPCDDGKPCTKDYCDVNKGCLIDPEDNSLTCSDGNACTFEFCSAGNCVGGSVTCDDKNGCTADSCDPKSGCVYTPTTAPCDDGNVCTSNDACANKACAGTNNTATCDDYHPCTTNEKCKDGSCTDTKPVVCPDDGNFCTLEECSYWGGCKVTGIKTCSDGNPCTDDSCNVGTGQCDYAANTVSCSDGELCTLGDYCSGKKCNAGKLNECEDGNICTNDSCVAGSGCKHEVVQTCEDGNLCTVDDLCVFGSCLAGGDKNCDDANACTTDYCIAPGGGCGHDPLVDGAPCDDGVLCTLPDTCQAGSCKVGPKVCDYAITSLGDGEFQSPKDNLWYPDHGTLREAFFDAQFKPVGQFTVRFFVAGKLTLTKPLISLGGDWTLDGAGQTILVDGGGVYQALYIH